MSANHPTAPTQTVKPSKPYPEYPLTAHPAGYWCKKIRGKVHYFGPRFKPDDLAAAAAAADEALKDYQAKKDDLHAGRKPREATDGLTVKALCNKFADAKEELVNTGELSPRTFADYKDACAEIMTAFRPGRLVTDLDPDDFAKLRNSLAKKYGPVRLGNTIQRIRSIFKFAFDDTLIPTPLRFGPGFKRPSRKTLRIHRAKGGTKLFTADEVRRMIAGADTPLKAMILLGINCGFGNADCGQLPLSAVDLDAGVIDFPRPKTGIARRVILWPETILAIREAQARRPQPKNADDAALVFLTKYGQPWAKDTPDSPVAKETAKLLRTLGINGRKGLGFYTLRHTFRTVADEAKDQPAADFIMGHEVPHMSAVYRETISDARLRAVTDHVHGWLFPPVKAE
jgi:integrase